MFAPRRKLLLATLGILAFYATSTDAQDGPGSKKERLTAAECRQLIARLVNPDKPPFTKSFVLRLPEGVDEKTLRRKQGKITAAYQALSDNIEVSLPILAKNVNDRRFSFVYTSISGAITTESVGGACSDIIFAHVEVYRRHTTRPDFSGIPRCPSFIGERGGFEKWWESRKGKSLAELQLEGIEWVLRQDKPKEFESEEEWAKAKQAVARMAKDIRASKKPIAVEHYAPGLEVFK